MQSVDDVLLLKGELDDLRPLDREQEGRIMQKFRLDWNYHSNHIEGNSLNYGETKALLLFGITAQGKPLADHIEMQGHNDAVNWIMDVVKGDYPLNETFIRELHTLLLQKPYEVKAQTADGKPTTKVVNIGQYKQLPNHVRTVTGEIFYFASPEETPALMEGLIDWYREMDSNPRTNHVLLAAEFHYRFIRIHPFDDGNGRTARLLMNFILLRHGYPPVVIKSEDKANYLSALEQADAGILNTFLDYIGQNLIASLNLMIRGAKGENIEEPDDLDKKIEFLAQMLEVDSRKVVKSAQVVEELILHSLLFVYGRLKDEAAKFERFYSDVTDFVSWDPTQIPSDNGKNGHLERLKLIIGPANHEYYYIVFNFKSFRHPNYKHRNHKMTVQVRLQEWSYTISSGEVTFTRRYKQDLNEEEIFRLVRNASELHLEDIQEVFSEENQVRE
jgi:Fic family protein